MSPQGRKWVDRGPGPLHTRRRWGGCLCLYSSGGESYPETPGETPWSPAREGPKTKAGGDARRIEVRTLNPKEASVHPPSAAWQDPGCTQPG